MYAFIQQFIIKLKKKGVAVFCISLCYNRDFTSELSVSTQHIGVDCKDVDSDEWIGTGEFFSLDLCSVMGPTYVTP